MSTPVTSGGGGGSGRGGSLEAHLAKLEAALADRRERVAKLEEFSRSARYGTLGV